MEEIKFGITKADLVKLLGEPKKESQVDNQIILRYNSNTERYADYYYFENDGLVIQSISKYKDELTLGDYVKQYGSPNDSFHKAFKEGALDSNEYVHNWLEKGIEVITLGNQVSSKVLRERNFQPVEESLYKETFAKEYTIDQKTEVLDLKINEQEVDIISVSSVKEKYGNSGKQAVELLEKNEKNNFPIFIKSNIIPILVVVVIVILVLIFFFIIPFFKMRKKNQRTKEIHLENKQ